MDLEIKNKTKVMQIFTLRRKERLVKHIDIFCLPIEKSEWSVPFSCCQVDFFSNPTD
jgi:hypothetical protein